MDHSGRSACLYSFAYGLFGLSRRIVYEARVQYSNMCVLIGLLKERGYLMSAVSVGISSSADALNEQLVDIWQRYRARLNHKFLNRAPLFFGDFSTHCILFIGFNPSYSPRGSRARYANTKYKDLSSKDFQWKRMEGKELEEYIDRCNEIEKISRKKYSYFKIFHEIAQDSKLEFEHIDLFFLREKSQNKVRELVYPIPPRKQVSQLTPFGNDQIQVSFAAIDIIEPEIIFVANAVASEIIRNQRGERLKWEESLGTDTLLVKGKKVPIFFSGMISGQRRLDNESLKRLKWHIRYVLKHLNLLTD